MPRFLEVFVIGVWNHNIWSNTSFKKNFKAIYPNLFSETDWQTKASTVESFDFDTGAFVLTVPPKEVVRILRGSDSLVYRDDSENFFPLVNLETSDDEGAVHVYPSGRMLSQFKERGKGNYFLANY